MVALAALLVVDVWFVSRPLVPLLDGDHEDVDEGLKCFLQRSRDLFETKLECWCGVVIFISFETKILPDWRVRRRRLRL